MIDARSHANERFFAAEAERIGALAQRLADGFRRGGTLLAVGESPQDRSDAQHVAVEFVHPVIVGKRALPALALRPHQVGSLAGPQDMLIEFGGPSAAPPECLRIGFTPGEGEWRFGPPTADPFIRQELVETLYHVLWETVHVFLDHGASSSAGAGGADFLYPFLTKGPGGGDEIRADAVRSIRRKAEEVGDLRRRTIDGADIAAVADALRGRLEDGGRVLAFGNGGSATDAMDLVADLEAAGRPALDLTGDCAILTALANDVGPEVLFQRQVIAHGRGGDVAVAFSTSGGSANILSALHEARRRGLLTVALVGYDGGQIAAEGLADHVIRAPSEYIPRIQEAHATAYHLLCGLIGAGVRPAPAGVGA